MDLFWGFIITGTVLMYGYFIYTASEKKIHTLEKKVSQLEKQLTHIQQGKEWVEPDVNDELRELLQKGKMVEAVKRTREEFGWSLLDAKQYVDRLKEDH
ncbi:hypothetical protein GPDM_09270 [Planococcus donghaensis MPA1U2]|uniref:Ribosomal protein L7/L12 C-terminal domain-containing protein n=1 Tax=Planococcus donghaensis MPA1U2 TaxID=933115 RepID=E7RHN1_9BACL|nr:hypothetical protein [Planococcus donghaensis]EGA89475.1 hypothetical protein GPDM_09270 [Planococcus donghaensis MPA1U2]